MHRDELLLGTVVLYKPVKNEAGHNGVHAVIPATVVGVRGNAANLQLHFDGEATGYRSNVQHAYETDGRVDYKPGTFCTHDEYNEEIHRQEDVADHHKAQAEKAQAEAANTGEAHAGGAKAELETNTAQ